MAKNKNDLFALINTNLPDNTSKAITPANVREVETQNADSALNVLETAAQVVAGPVNFTGGLSKGGASVITGAKEVDLLRAFATTDQLPASLGTPLQITFGAAQLTPSDPVSLSAAGALTFNQAGTYAIRIRLQYGRVGSTGISVMMQRALINGVQAGNTLSVKISSADFLANSEARIVVVALAGQVLTVQIIRDSTGVNSGGLYAVASAHGWNAAPSALMVVSRIEGS